MKDEHPPIAFIGGGNMASAIIRGASGRLDETRVFVADPDEKRRSAFRNGLATAAEAVEAMIASETNPGDGQVVLAVKPQVFPSVAAEIGRFFRKAPGRVVVSILAGTRSGCIRSALGPGARVVRVMPNTPARIGLGMSAICPGDGARPGDERLAARLMRTVGDVVSIGEDLMDAFTALSGSGPAYVFYLAEAMEKAGVETGFEPDLARRITARVLAGASEILVREGGAPAEHRAAVTSKGGTTAAAAAVLDKAGVKDAIVRAVIAARNRGRALSGEACPGVAPGSE